MAIENVKVARAQHVSTIIETLQKQFRLHLGENEIAIVHKVLIVVDLFVVNQSVKVGVYRKTTNLSSDITVRDQVVEDKNWLTWTTYDTGDAGYTSGFAFLDDINFTPGMILVRSPQLVLRNIVAEAAAVIATLYYTTKIVNDKTIAELLMKYHG